MRGSVVRRLSGLLLCCLLAFGCAPLAPRREAAVEVGRDGTAAARKATLPSLLWPVRGGALRSVFGEPRAARTHQGIDIGAGPGDAVRAAADGVVRYAGSSMRGYGRTVILDHGAGMRTLYAHNKTLLVRPGDRVRGGQPIARAGRSGNATGVHCHFEVRLDDVPVDPMPYLMVREARR